MSEGKENGLMIQRGLVLSSRKAAKIFLYIIPRFKGRVSNHWLKVIGSVLM